MEEKIIVVAIVVEDRMASAEAINGILHQHAQAIRGRLGLPGATAKGDVITITLQGSDSIGDFLEESLNALSGVQCKTARFSL